MSFYFHSAPRGLKRRCLITTALPERTVEGLAVVGCVVEGDGRASRDHDSGRVPLDLAGNVQAEKFDASGHLPLINWS